MSTENRELLEKIYTAMMRADARGFEGSAAALRDVLDNLTRERPGVETADLAFSGIPGDRNRKDEAEEVGY